MEKIEMDSADRRSFLVGLSSAGLLCASGQARAAGRARHSFRVALSVSPFSENVLKEGPLSDGVSVARSVADLQRMYLRHGATEVYQRVAGRRVSPQGPAEHGWARGLERAALARSLGLPFNPEIGIFANYGDVAVYQEAPDFSDYPDISLPGKWTSLTVEQMVPVLRTYGAIVARQILKTGVRVNYWDVGNEAEMGVAAVTPRPLLPTDHYQAPDAVDPAIAQMEAKTLFKMPERERIAWCEAHIWPHTARLLGAVAEGIRSVDRSARFSSHISSAFQLTSAVPLAFWQSMRRGGYSPDQFGQSVWGTQAAAHGGPVDTFAWIKETSIALRQRLGRPMFLAEFGFPSGPMPAPFDWNDPQKGYPINDTGQHDYVRDVTAWGSRTGNISGIRPWAPDLCIGGWSNMSFFRRTGEIATAKPALDAMRQGLASVGATLPR